MSRITILVTITSAIAVLIASLAVAHASRKNCKTGQFWSGVANACVAAGLNSKRTCTGSNHGGGFADRACAY